MADNTTQNGTAIVAADEVTYSGDTTQLQIVQLAFVTGSEGSRTAAKAPGDSTDGFKVQVNDGKDATQGVTTGAAVTTDANGTVQQYLRGLVTQIGAVTASPVANSVADRLKSLLTGIVLAAGSAIIGKVGIDQTTPGTTNQVNMSRNVSVIKTSITRPGNTTPYTANTVLSNSTSAPTAGGGTITAAARASGGSGTITGVIVGASAGTAINGEIWIFDQAPTAKNDNAAFDVSDSDLLNLVCVLPFNIADTTSSNAISYVKCDEDYTCVGTANLRFLVKVMSAVTPGNAEVISFAFKVRN